MSGVTLPDRTHTAHERIQNLEQTAATQDSILREFAQALSSLKTTVWLFALTIFLVFAGTLAQTEQEIWQVVDTYFRSFLVWIEFGVFAPKAWFPHRPPLQGGFYFPGGWTLGILLAFNLIAAHGLRFQPQVRGWRLALGIGVILAGAAVTWLVIASGSTANGLQSAAWISWTVLWRLYLVGLAGLFGAATYFAITTDSRQRRERRIFALTAILLGILLIWLVAQEEAGRLDDSAMRILWQLTKGTAAGLVLLAGCGILFRKRAGVVLVHAGVALLMFSELLVGMSAVEAKMQVVEGQSVNYVDDSRQLELAIVDRSSKEADDVVVVPQSLLLGGETIRHDDLPFDVRVDAFYKNSVLRPAPPGALNPATAGLGQQWMAEEARPVSGTDTSGKVDQPAAYVTFLNKANSTVLGTHLVSLVQSLQELPEKVTVGTTPYKVSLRFKRTYKPYSIQLVDVRKDDYMGTSTARNYSSQVRVIDEAGGVDRTVRIWMNNPLRYAGETFYQSGYFRDPQTGFESTTLQVVTNTGWMIPYIACMVVATGLLAHFSLVLLRFLRRREQESARRADSADGSSSTSAGGLFRMATNWKVWGVPVCLVLLLGAWIATKASVRSVPADQIQIYEFGRLPVVYQGRIEPIDTLARNSLRILSGRQTFVDNDGRAQPAIRWLLDVIAKPETAAEHRVFRIEHPELLSALGLEPRNGFRFAWSEFRDHRSDISKQAIAARAQEPAPMSIYQKKVVELDYKFGLFELLQSSFVPPAIRTDAELRAVDLRVALQEQELLTQQMPPLAIPPRTSTDSWNTYTEARLQEMQNADSPNPDATSAALTAWNRIRDAYASSRTAEFNSEVAEFLQWVATERPSGTDLRKTNFEVFFNRFEPFYLSAVLYVIAFLLAASSWLGWSRSLNRAAFGVVALALIVHTFAILARIYISGRPPVTNLYSSAVFIGWGAVLLGLTLEIVYRMGIGNVIASASGFVTLLIAHFLAGDGDTMAVLQAVLDTQFWLATHVVCITLGYATTYVAGMLGLLYILRGVLTPTLRPATGKELVRMTYGVLCFALFFSFVGTVLGGLWADDSWGRFWGWDPKENGALIIVLWNALVLHARWGRLVQDRGVAVLAVAGNVAVSWSWFGVNELGVGLHSYGFTEGVLKTLAIFIASQLAIIAIGLLPLNWWWSARRHSAVT